MIVASETDKIGHPKKRAFLAAFRETASVSRAATMAGIRRGTHYDWLKDEAYAASFRIAQERAIQSLEDEAVRRAYEGIEEPVFQAGRQVGVVRKYSDTLLIFLLKGLRPQKYKDRIAAEHSGEAGGQPIVIQISEADARL